jgi:hypothetical protein
MSSSGERWKLAVPPWTCWAKDPERTHQMRDCTLPPRLVKLEDLVPLPAVRELDGDGHQGVVNSRPSASRAEEAIEDGDWGGGGD